MVRVPAGYFWMGSDQSDPETLEEEEPRHWLYLPEFWIGRYPVTVTQFAAFVKDTGYTTTSSKIATGWWWPPLPGHWQPLMGKDDHPMTWLSWYDAIAYCQWLSGCTGRRYTLPSEAEWEKAARGEDGRIYPWGNEWDPDRCNLSESRKGDTTPVGLYSPHGDSPFGCADMAGNAWEWTRSLWGKDYCAPEFRYPYASMDGREDMGAPRELQRIIRGGSFTADRLFVRCAFRFSYYPRDGYLGIGFRVVASP
jgi:formylglycine-generating enzyme required for sulfatase activity